MLDGSALSVVLWWMNSYRRVPRSADAILCELVNQRPGVLRLDEALRLSGELPATSITAASPKVISQGLHFRGLFERIECMVGL